MEVFGTKIDAFDRDLNVLAKKIMSFKQKIKIFGQIIETLNRKFYFFEYIFFF